MGVSDGGERVIEVEMMYEDRCRVSQQSGIKLTQKTPDKSGVFLCKYQSKGVQGRDTYTMLNITKLYKICDNKVQNYSKVHDYLYKETVLFEIVLFFVKARQIQSFSCHK